VICDQVTFLLLATAAIVTGIRSSASTQLSFKSILKRIISFPAFPACILALVLPRYIDITPLDPFFDKIALTVPPLALFSIGLQLQFSEWKGQLKHITAALVCKLLIAPVMVLLMVLLVNGKGIEARIGIFEACMPTLVSSGIIAAEYRLNPRLSSLIIGAGIITALFTTALWYLLIVAVVPL
jgi:malate permease and related proteins